MNKRVHISLFCAVIVLGIGITDYLPVWANETGYEKATVANGIALDRVIECFAGKNTDFTVTQAFTLVKRIETKNSKNETINFYGIHKNDQEKVDFAKLKMHLLSHSIIKQKRIIQVIGDSDRFSREGTEYGRNFLSTHCFEKDCIIEYGFTGYLLDNELDINSFVNEYLNNNPEQAHRVIANVVGHSHIAINKWNCLASKSVKNFVVIYNDSGMDENSHTQFGDDVIASDYILHWSDRDHIICMEGGAQSFRQVINALRNGITIDLIYNVRRPERTGYFSAARFLQKVYEHFMSTDTCTKEMVQEIFDDYSKPLKSLWDEKKPDYKTKKALFDEAKHWFIEKELYVLVPHLCRFYNAQPRIKSRL